MKKFMEKYKKVIWCFRNFIPMLLFPVANFYLFEWYTHNPWETMKVPIQFLNIYFFELLMVIFLFIFGRLKWSLRLQSIFFMIVGLANYYVIEFRSAPIRVFDSCHLYKILWNRINAAFFVSNFIILYVVRCCIIFYFVL